jgi:cytochrome P450
MAPTAARTAEMRFDDPAFYLDDPHRAFAQLRRTDPVHWYGDGPFWVATKYEDIRFISQHPELFSSRNIAILGDIIKIREGQPRPPRDSIMFMDPPEHRLHRRVMIREFTPARVNQMQELVEGVVVSALDAVPEGPFDAIPALAEVIPVNVFCALLGIPREDWHRVVKWSSVVASSGGGGETPETMAATYAELVPYLEALLEERTRQPADDYLSMVANAQVAGEPLTHIQVVWWAISLLAAGSETTQSLIAGLLYAMSQSPEQTERVLKAPARMAARTVDETLRWWSPVNSMARQAVVDVELRGTTMEAGDAVLLAYMSANRDEDEWGDDADTWNVDRAASNHLAFGFAEHYCIGAHLAKREATVLVREMAKRWTGVELVAPPVRRNSALMTTFDTLEVQFTA